MDLLVACWSREDGIASSSHLEVVAAEPLLEQRDAAHEGGVGVRSAELVLEAAGEVQERLAPRYQRGEPLLPRYVHRRGEEEASHHPRVPRPPRH